MNQLLFFLSFLVLQACTTSVNKKETKDEITFSNVLACTLSEIAYCTQPQDSLSKYLPSWKLIWNPDAVNGNYAFAATDGKKIAVAIRGSLLRFEKDAFDNWVRHDLNVVVQKGWPYTDSTGDAKVSQGSYEAWENMTLLKDKSTGKTLLEFLDSSIAANTALLITGHSLGGNLAVIYGSWLMWRFKGKKKTVNHFSIITFAAPAAGNEAFANDFNKKFPNSVRIENTNDIVPKFPVAETVGNLGKLFNPGPSASETAIDFSFISIKLSTVFSTLKLTLKGFEVYNNNSVYTQTNGAGKTITIKLSGKNNNNEVADWFAEAGYQHSIEHYAAAIGAPVIKTE
jgi:hypothetical protein